jgi:glycosyltransferase involved in cell wall biosynthesis
VKVLYVSRPDNFTQPGGDSLHLEYTVRHLQKLKVECHIWRGEKVDLQEYDLIHFFNLSRPTALLPFLKGEHPPIICSSIYIDYSKSDTDSSKLRGFLQRGLGPHATEYLKTIGRSFKFKTEKLSLKYLCQGQLASVQEVLKNCQHLIGSSQAEIDIIKQNFKLEHLPSSVIPLGIEHMPPLKHQSDKSGIICVARFEPLKNQLRLIKACKQLEPILRLIGSHSRAHHGYYQACKNIAGNKVKFFGQKSHEEAALFMAQSKVHVLASHYETTGLASLEALYYGCQIVVNDHPIQREIFGDHAHYCDPLSIESITEAIQAALLDQRDHREWLVEKFSWKKKAVEIKALYSKVLRA